jgi:succinoglycan biosynthesis protein ExoA
MQPFVSIIVPCYNEEKTIPDLLSAVFAQTYPHARMELVIADGMSTDKTRELIDQLSQDNKDLTIKVLDNPLRNIPSALNRAIRESTGEMIVRLDAHCMPIPEYVERCVAALQSGKGDNVGGVWEIRRGADTWIAESISVAAAHPLGVGDAMYRLKAGAGAVDTVPFGSFHRTLIDRIGFFDEALLANEDYEFNARLRGSGGTVWLDPSIRSIYFSRASLGALAAQYWRYGFWKWRMLRRYPHTLRWRQALPPLFVLSLIILIVLCLLTMSACYLLFAEVILYFAVLCAAGLKTAVETRNPLHLLGLPLAIATMHLAWGSGFLWSALLTPFAVRKNG